MTAGEFTEYLESKIPLNLCACDDNSGFLIGDKTLPVKKVLLCLDVTLAVIQEAKENNIDLILSHHPVIFNAVKKITADDLDGKKIINIIKNGLNVYSAHTSLDSADGGINDFVANSIGLNGIERFGDGEWSGGRIGYFKNPVTLQDLAQKIKSLTGEQYIGITGKKGAVIKKAALICGGAGNDAYVKLARQQSADVYISGDFRHHTLLNAYQENFNLIISSHYALERTILNPLKENLTKDLDGIEVIISRSEKNPLEYL